MNPLGRDLLDMIPFRDAEACDYVRGIPRSEITRREAHHHADFSLRVIAGAEALYDALAEDMYGRISVAAQKGREFVGVFPVGPTGQYPLLARKINERRLSCAHVSLFFLDEYAYEDGRTIDKRSPWSFEFTARQKLLEAVEPPLRPKAIYFPGSENIDRYDDLVMQASGGRGADMIYGGIGWCGHFAFWDPHLWEEFEDEQAWREAPSSFVRLHPMTILHNALRAGGDWSSIPPCAYTIGPRIMLSAQYRSFWLDAYLGSGMSWQRFIGRLATHGPVTPLVPASYLQTAPGEVVFLDAVAEDIGGPKTSWQ
ncbi:MAG: 6-phosphogluconolactonase [Armatimonadota bacterium]